LLASDPEAESGSNPAFFSGKIEIYKRYRGIEIQDPRRYI
jgi:hypothetical protein